MQAGRDKVTLVIDQDIETFGLWLEQLLAESTGKQGTGVIPIAGERLGPPEVYGDDRLFVGIGEHHGLAPLADAGHPVVELGYGGPLDLGGQVLLWELATAVCGAVLGINPFDQPNVAEAKEATAAVLHGAEPPDIEVEALAPLLDQVRAGDYVAIQAYVDPESGVVDAIEDARTAIRDRLRVATTVGHRPPLPPLHRPAAQGRAADRGVRPGGRRRPGGRGDPRSGLHVLVAQAGAGRRRPADPAPSRPAGRHGWRSTTSWR